MLLLDPYRISPTVTGPHVFSTLAGASFGAMAESEIHNLSPSENVVVVVVENPTIHHDARVLLRTLMCSKITRYPVFLAVVCSIRATHGQAKAEAQGSGLEKGAYH